MRRKVAFLMIAVILASALPALCAEVIRFKSGTVLVVNQYRVEGNMIYALLGNGAEIAFPASFVDKIESKDVGSKSREAVFNRAISSTSSNLGDGNISIPGAPSEGWSQQSTAYSRVNQTKNSQTEPLNVPGIYQPQSDNPALKDIRVMQRLLPGRSSSKPQDTSETGSNQRAVIAPVRGGPEGQKPQITELKPKNPSQ